MSVINRNGEKPLALIRFGKQSGSPTHRLYAFAHAGGTASTYAPWAKLLAPEIELFGVEMPGHGTRILEDPFTSVAEMASEVARELRGVQENGLHLPIAFYGHSLGALVAFETASMLFEDTGVGPSGLFLGAARAPHYPPVVPSVSHLEEDAFLVAVQQRYGGIPAAVLQEPELLETILPGMQADFVAYESYRYLSRPRLPCAISAFVGLEDPIVLPAAVEGWAHHTSGPFRLQAVPGDHFFLNQSRQQVLSDLSHTLLGDAFARQAPSAKMLLPS